tara:strand:+ start:48 stop:554 length:507 start_codon:yes stop_codon:yes gene_type:complete
MNPIKHKPNGRVDIENQLPDQNMFSMCDKIPVRDPIGYADALKGNLENTPLANEFFSTKNIFTIQYNIKQEVYNLSNQKYMIDNQNEDVLKIIMRSIFLQNSAHLPNQIQEQVNQLNQLVVDYCAPCVYTEVLSYMKYKQDVSNLAVPLEHPKHSNYKYKTLELKKWF